MEKAFLKLSMLKGPETGSSFVLSANNYVIGRRETNSICILDSSVSKSHCQIIKSGGGYFIIDLNSRNGTFLNGTRLDASRMYELKAGHEVRIGGTLMHVGVEQRPSDEMKALEDETTCEIKRKFDERSRKGVDVYEEPDAKTESFRIGENRNHTAIYKMLSQVGTATNMDFLVDTTLELVMEFIKPERGLIFLREELKGDKFIPRSEKSRYGEGRGDSGGISKTVVNRVLRERDSVLSTETVGDQRFSKAKSVVDFQIKSIVCSPVKSRDKLLGLIYLDTTRPGELFSSEDLELLSSIGVQLGTLVENIELSSDNRDLFLGIVGVLIKTIEAKDKYTFGHSERVTAISVAIAQELDMGSDDVETVRLSSLLHDIGKVGVPEEILNKPGRLTDEEFGMIKKHPVIGQDLVKHIRKFDIIQDGILYHHERFDGKGYPEGRAGQTIPEIARIIAVADSFDAMTSDRAYRKNLGDEKALEELARNQDVQFDGKMVRAFQKAYDKGRIPGTKVSA